MIPSDLKDFLPHPQTPWKISPEVSHVWNLKPIVSKPLSFFRIIRKLEGVDELSEEFEPRITLDFELLDG